MANHLPVFVSEVASLRLHSGNFPNKLVTIEWQHALGNIVTGRSSMLCLHHKVLRNYEVDNASRKSKKDRRFDARHSRRNNLTLLPKTVLKLIDG